MTTLDEPAETVGKFEVVMDVYDVVAYTKHLSDQGNPEGAQKVWAEGGGKERVSIHDTYDEALREAWTPTPIPGVRYRVDEIEVSG